ncbi:MAG: site-specific DNA-methyltransferase [Chloroflexi bacterium]|nr:site-specific DNA-methyltransferase [Chloroflexota bacterium]
MTSFRILEGDCRERLRELPAGSVHTCITSPPYYGLRSYGTNPQIWGGNPPDCDHLFEEVFTPNQNCGAGVTPKDKDTERDGGPLPCKDDGPRGRLSAFCSRCGCWRGELGSEVSPSDFVAHLVDVFAEVRRCLHPSGLLLVNLGDSYNGSGGAGGDYGPGGLKEGQPKFKPTRDRSIPRKSLIGIPQRFALAMVEAGWIWRAEMCWIKNNPMPSSATDRPSVAHEWFLMFSQSERYFWDMDAVRVRHVTEWIGQKTTAIVNPDRNDGGAKCTTGDPAGRAYRTSDPFRAGLDEAIEEQERYLAHLRKIKERGGLLVDPEGDPFALCVNTQGSSLEHYAGYPVKLVDPLVRAGCPAGGTVLDPFSGTGSTGVAALRNGRSYLGIELNEKYAAMSRERLEKETMQVRIPFAAEPSSAVTATEAAQTTLFDAQEATG